jgi:cytochrome c biogenesis protein
MSASQEIITTRPAVRPTAPILNRFLDSISSVRLGVVTLCMMVVLAMAGMLIMQQEVEGFEQYYVSLTPAERLVFGYLGLFDVYHSWYFNLLLLFLSLNIILASIDRFPSAWSYLAKPKVKGTRGWLLARRENLEIQFPDRPSDEAAARIGSVFKAHGLKTTVTHDNGATYVFGESGRWNRLGAYVVHVALLTLFLGHFVALQTGFSADVRMVPGEVTDQIQLIQFNLDKKERFNVQIPFAIECTDIQQRLIDEKGNIEVNNTLDWRTQIRIKDPAYGESLADVSLNRPVSYRGYRFFQAQTIPVGNARTIGLELAPQAGGDPIKVDLDRNGSTTLPDGTKVEYDEFLPDFTFGSDGKPDTRSGEYNNPAAVLNVTPPGGERTRVFAFAQKLPDNAPVGAPKAGYKWHMASFEKSPLAHILSIKYDPYSASFIAWYIGGFGLVGALMFVFFLSHKRVWAMVEPNPNGGSRVVLAGEANRNQIGFGDKFRKIADDLGGDQGQ